MTKQEFLKHLSALYACGNRSDHEARHEHKEEWTKPQMAGPACCALIDDMLNNLQSCGAITSDERQSFYDCL